MNPNDKTSAATTATDATTTSSSCEPNTSNSEFSSVSSIPVASGRVVRLHFWCRAELPLGSVLRVTGSTLWAPSSSTPPDDPMNAHHIAHDNTAESFPTQNEATSSAAVAAAANFTPDASSHFPLYTSSVEMVTTPETYPMWKTKRPVVVVLNKTKKQMQHHYYRYLVVTPGAFLQEAHEDENIDESNLKTTMTSTTHEFGSSSTPVMKWENPFLPPVINNGNGSSQMQREQSSRSLISGAGMRGGNFKTELARLAKLPYRTLDINVESAKCVQGGTLRDDEHDDDSGFESLSGSRNNRNEDEISDTNPAEDRVDTWNNGEDASFRSYLIRESMNSEQNHGRNQLISKQLSEMSAVSMDDAAKQATKNVEYDIAELAGVIMKQDETEATSLSTTNIIATDPTKSTISSTSSSPHQTRTSSHQKVFFVCFHLPVFIVKCSKTGEWKATWSESILAHKEGSRIAQSYQSHYIGTVTTIPPISNSSDQEQVRALLEEMDCTPIFLPPAIVQAHYYGFCKQVLWPAFHNIDLLDLSASGTLAGEATGGTTSSRIGAIASSTSATTEKNHKATASGTINDVEGGSEKHSASDNEGNPKFSDWDQSRLDDWWNAYQRVNQEFADVVQRLIDHIVGPTAAQNPVVMSKMAKDCYLWIHDYHLCLLPRMLQKSEPGRSCRKVFYLHIPFPTSQIFRELECGESILQGMLHADVVGFHAFDHARHFLNAAKRILGLNYESLVGGLIGVNFMGRTVLVSMSNVSIESKITDAALALPSVATIAKSFRDKHANRTIIAGLDIGQRLSGTSLKLLAYERLLQDYPSWQSRVVMVQRVLVPGSRKADEESTTRELRCLVKRIQDRFGPAVIDYEEIHGSSRLPMDQRLALWKSSAVFMITPIREGLNQWPMEYIYTRKDGVVIASEFSAISSILNGALRVNPFDIQMTITVIDKALSMNKAEREGRRYRDIDFVSNSPSDKWVRNVLRDLKDATRKQSSTSSLSSSLGGSGNNSSTATPLGGMTPTMSRTTSESILQGTAGFLLKESDEAFIRLNMQHLHQAYRVTTQRVIILDFNGTIVLKEPPGKYLKREILGTSGNKPPPHVLDSLALLCADKRNTVYVVSGDSSENVLNALGHIKGLGLAVSNGAKFAEPVTDEKPTRKWQSFDLGVDWAAVKRVALPVLSKYTARSNGSFVKLTAFSIGWSYYSCDPEWGSLQASHLVLELESELRQFDVRFVTLKGVVEIVPRRLNKGLIVKKVLRDVSIRNPPENNVDFIMCLGDDISDEKMFTSVLSFVAEVGHEDHAEPGPLVVNEDGTLVVEGDFNVDGQRRTNKIRDPMFCYTVAVGKKPSHASMYVNDAQEVAKALVLLANGNASAVGGPSTWDRGNSSHLFV